MIDLYDDYELQSLLISKRGQKLHLRLVNPYSKEVLIERKPKGDRFEMFLFLFRVVVLRFDGNCHSNAFLQVLTELVG